MENIVVQGIVGQLNAIVLEKSKLSLELLNMQEELKNTYLYKQIKELESKVKELDLAEESTREQGKEIMLSNGLKKFEALDGTTIQLNKKPGSLVIEDESKVPAEYIKEKVTTSIDKKQLKEDISQGLLIDGVYITEDYSLVIKN